MRTPWAVLGPSCGHSRPSWGDIGGLLGRLGASEARNGENAKIFQKREKICDFCLLGPLGGPLGALLGRLGGLLDRLETVLGRLEAIFSFLGRSFGDSAPSWGVLGASWGPVGPSWGPLGPPKVTRQAAGGLRRTPGGTRQAQEESVREAPNPLKTLQE